MDSGRELLLKLAEHPRAFHLILTDVAMPDVNGLEVLRYVRSQPALHNLPVIMMSAHENAGTGARAPFGPTSTPPTHTLSPVFECIHRGAEDYLLKPVTQKEVKQIWQHVWRRRCTWRRVAAEVAAGLPQPTPEETEAARAAVSALVPPEGEELYTAAEMRQHCMRQIALYQRMINVIDEHPQLFPEHGGEKRRVEEAKPAAIAA